MRYYVHLFSPATYEDFNGSPRNLTGFKPRFQSAAGRVSSGDRFLCYITGLGRWTGVLEVVRGPFEDQTQLYGQADPYSLRFEVRVLAWLEKDFAVDIREPKLWRQLSFTKDHALSSAAWTGPVRSSLKEISASVSSMKRRGRHIRSTSVRGESSLASGLQRHRA